MQLIKLHFLFTLLPSATRTTNAGHANNAMRSTTLRQSLSQRTLPERQLAESLSKRQADSATTELRHMPANADGFC